MKKYKFLIPILLVFLFLISVYVSFDNKVTDAREYNKYLEDAHSFRKQDIQVDALENYMHALEKKPSIELNIEIGNYYHTIGKENEAIECGEHIISKYPKNVEGYEYLIDLYMAKCDYVACFGLADTMTARKLSSKKIDGILEEIAYKFECVCDYSDVGAFSNGLCPVNVENKWGYVDSWGKQVIPVEFVSAGYHSDGLAPVIDAKGNVFYIDSEGNKKKVILNIKPVKELGYIENGIFSLFNGETWGFYNNDEELLCGGYSNVSAMSDGVAAVEKSQKWMIIDASGKNVSGKSYDGVVMDEKRIVCRNGRIFVYEDDACNMIDRTGKVIGKKYEDARLFNDDTYAAVKINGKWGFIDNNGNLKIEPKYEDARSFSFGLAAVKYKGKWGFINSKDEAVIDFQFDESKDFNSRGNVFIKKEEKWNLLRLIKYNH